MNLYVKSCFPPLKLSALTKAINKIKMTFIGSIWTCYADLIIIFRIVLISNTLDPVYFPSATDIDKTLPQEINLVPFKHWNNQFNINRNLIKQFQDTVDNRKYNGPFIDYMIICFIEKKQKKQTA